MQRYTENTIAKFDDLIRESDPPVQYTVAVDELTVVARTSDPAKFMGHARFVDGETSKVTVKLYHGVGNRNDTTELWLKPPKDEGLDGIEQRVLAGIAAERRQWEFDRALEKIEELKAELKESEDYADKLEAEVKEFRAKKLHVGDVNLLEVIGFVAEGWVKRNPSVIARIPGGEALAGAIAADNLARESSQPPNTLEEQPAAFSRAAATPQPDDRNAGLIRQLHEFLPEDEFSRVIDILGEVIDDRSLIPAFEQTITDRQPEPII